MAEKEIKVVGMHCPSCVNAVELCLKDVDGIDDAKADLDSGITKITMSADVTSETLFDMVTELSAISEASLQNNQQITKETETLLQGSVENTQAVEDADNRMQDISRQLTELGKMNHRTAA